MADDHFVIKKPKAEKDYSVLIEKDKDRFLTARNGDHFHCRFQCNLCHFRNIQGRYPDLESYEEDALLLRCIRRASLDVFWVRESSTVFGDGRELRTLTSKAGLLELNSVFPPLGPLPVEDVQGMG